jgi:hypothetical protein
MPRLAHLTQGEWFLTLRDKWPALEHHVGMMTKKSSKSGNYPMLWNSKSGISFSSNQP